VRELAADCGPNLRPLFRRTAEPDRRAGKQANCQVAVTLSIANHYASLPTPIDCICRIDCICCSTAD
jgi:hypothetical protein